MINKHSKKNIPAYNGFYGNIGQPSFGIFSMLAEMMSEPIITIVTIENEPILPKKSTVTIEELEDDPPKKAITHNITTNPEQKTKPDITTTPITEPKHNPVTNTTTKPNITTTPITKPKITVIEDDKLYDLIKNRKKR
jgi:hypothetical protein